MSKRISISPEQKFERLTFIEELPIRIGSGGRHVRRGLFRCSCGQEVITDIASAVHGNTKSCGCLKLDMLLERLTIHGHNRKHQTTRTYRAWCHMKERCSNPNDKRWNDYGGRGITVCDRWRESFMNFLADMGECPPGLTIHRIDNNGNYAPGNCIWTTNKEQNRNQRTNRIETVFGVTGCVSFLAEHFGIKYGIVRKRLFRGWSLERTFSEPVH